MIAHGLANLILLLLEDWNHFSVAVTLLSSLILHIVLLVYLHYLSLLLECGIWRWVEASLHICFQRAQVIHRIYPLVVYWGELTLWLDGGVVHWDCRLHIFVIYRVIPFGHLRFQWWDYFQTGALRQNDRPVLPRDLSLLFTNFLSALKSLFALARLVVWLVHHLTTCISVAGIF